jgi:hypothetical protein
MKLLFGLRNYIKGKIDKYELVDSDRRIRFVSEKPNRSDSIIEIDLGDDGLLKLLGYSDDDIWFYNANTSPYSNGYEFEDEYIIKENFKDGYGFFWYDLDSENKKILTEISKYIYPSFDLDDEEKRRKFAELLKNYFPDEIYRILSEIRDETNKAYTQSATDIIKKEIKEQLKDIGLSVYNENTLKLTVSELIQLLVEKAIPHGSINDLLDKIREKYEDSVGGWLEDTYSFWDSEYLDGETLNRSINWWLEKILDQLQESDPESQEKYLNILNKITNNFNFDTWYSLPKNENYKFKIVSIDRIDRENHKIEVWLIKNHLTKKFHFSDENFYNLLYQPTLFNFDEVYGFSNS